MYGVALISQLQQCSEAPDSIAIIHNVCFNIMSVLRRSTFDESPAKRTWLERLLRHSAIQHIPERKLMKTILAYEMGPVVTLGSLDDPGSEITIRFDKRILQVDPAGEINGTTRHYLAGLVVAVLQLGHSFNNRYEPQSLERLKRAVQLLADSIDNVALHRILGSIWPRNHYIGDHSGAMELSAWGPESDWLVETE